MPRFLAAACWLCAVLLPVSAGALGLGEIDLKSALNEPFVADIPLQLDDPADLNSVNVYLASVATFERYGVIRAAYLSDFRFFLSTDDSGNGIVQVRSVRAVSEPFVTLLLEVEWPAGKLLREYTVLLDPPVFDAGAVATPVQPAESPAVADTPPDAIPEPVAAAQPEAKLEPVAPTVVPTVAPAPVIPVQEPEPLPQEPQPLAGTETTLSLAGSTYGPVTQGQTLWGLAQELRANSSVDINQMMLALYRTNPSAFIDNINRLKEGAILRIPDSDEIGAMTRSEAFAEAQRQHEQYGAGNASVAAVQLRLVPPADEVVDSSFGAAVGEVELETSATDVPESEPAASLVGQLEAEPEESSALVEIEDSELEALQDRLGQQDELDAGFQPALAEPEEPAETSTTESQEAPAVVPPAPQIDVVTTAGPAGESMLDQAIGLAEEYWMWAAGLLVAMVLLIGIRRRLAGGVVGKDGESGVDDDFAGSWDDDEPDAFEPKDSLDGLADDGDSFVVDEAAQATGDESVPQFGADLEDVPGEAAAADIPLEPKPAIDLPFEPEPDVLLEPAEEDLLEATVKIEPESELDLDMDALLEAEPESEPVPEIDALLAAEPESESAPEIDALLAAEPESEPSDTMPDFPEAVLEPTGEMPANPMAAEIPDLPVELEVPVEDVEGLLEATLSMPAPINLDQADPVAEAEFHMAYGLYDQAADLLIQALQADQDNRDLRVKLLEVYFVWENQEGFLTEARTLREIIANDSDPDWNKVLIMGKQICPDDEVFSAVASGTGVAESVDFSLFSEDGADAGLDIDISGGSEADGVDDLDLDLGADFSPGAETEVDLSLGSDSPTMESPTLDGPGLEPPMETLAIKALDGAMPELPGIGDAGGDGDDQTAGSGAVVDDDAATMIATDAAAAGVTIGDEEATMLSSDGALSVNEAPFKPKEIDATADWPVLDEAALSEIGADDLAAALGSGVDDETVDQLHGATEATVEQPHPDHGSGAVGLDEFADSSTMKAPGLDDLPDEPTMTEVGTKLDLARAYIDMGDPDGARSILKEVLDEGDDPQQQEARQLLDELKD
ncbi:MAG: hypothetical protein O6763_08795 [Gammaproteobacteria bacterium]|nr:hypothetical protein [Gammaproteobacteria bacterium]